MTARSTVPTPKKDRASGTWGFIFDSSQPKPDGTRRQIRRRGFATKAEAQAELSKAIAADRVADASADGLTVAGVIDQFIRASVWRRRRRRRSR